MCLIEWKVPGWLARTYGTYGIPNILMFAIHPHRSLSIQTPSSIWAWCRFCGLNMQIKKNISKIVGAKFLGSDSVYCEETVSPLSWSEAAISLLFWVSTAEMSRPIQNIPLEILAPMRLEFRPPSRARVTLSEECSARIPNGNIRANMNEATAGRYGRDERFSFFFKESCDNERWKEHCDEG